MRNTDGLPEDRLGRSIRGMWLVRMSLLLAICLEVIPIEMDIISFLWLAGAPRLALLAKLAVIVAVHLVFFINTKH